MFLFEEGADGGGGRIAKVLEKLEVLKKFRRALRVIWIPFI